MIAKPLVILSGVLSIGVAVIAVLAPVASAEEGFPEEVLSAWEELAALKVDRRLIVATEMPVRDPRVSLQDIHRWSSLGTEYSKDETLFPNATDPWSVDAVKESILYDGRHKYLVTREKPGERFILRLIDVGYMPFSVFPLKPLPGGPEIERVSFETLTSGANRYKLVEWDQSEGGDGLVRGTLECVEEGRFPARLEFTLDQRNRYRIVSCIVYNTDLIRARYDFEYAAHPALPVRHGIVREKKEDASADWKVYHEEQRRFQFADPAELTPSDFSIEYYGLPPYDERGRFNFRPYLLWVMLGLAVAGLWMIRRGAS